MVVGSSSQSHIDLGTICVRDLRVRRGGAKSRPIGYSSHAVLQPCVMLGRDDVSDGVAVAYANASAGTAFGVLCTDRSRAVSG